MPQTFYTEDEVQVYTRLLARAHATIADGPASDIAKTILLKEIAHALGWRRAPFTSR